MTDQVPLPSAANVAPSPLGCGSLRQSEGRAEGRSSIAIQTSLQKSGLHPAASPLQGGSDGQAVALGADPARCDPGGLAPDAGGGSSDGSRVSPARASITRKPHLLDLFCGAGGAARGYQQAGFYVVGVDIKPQPRYAGDEFIQADAMTFPLDGFDAIHASPPCQAYVQRNKNLKTNHPRLIAPIRARLQEWGGPYVIENVLPEVLESPAILCGTQFGLPLRRHRFFETNAGMILSRGCWHWGTVAAGDFAAVYAFGGKGHRHGPGSRDPRSAIGPEWKEAMGIDWMTRDELTQAIPPAYTEYIGRQLLAIITKEPASAPSASR